MTSLQNLSSKVGKVGHKARKRVGRGNGSGHGTFSCRGCKGQNARTGGGVRPGFEGGQTPFMRKLPKLKGFKNPNHIEFQVVNVGSLNIFDDKATIDMKALLSKNLVCKKYMPIKLLAGKGELTKQLTIMVDGASQKAIEMVEAKNGKVEIKVKKVTEATNA